MRNRSPIIVTGSGRSGTNWLLNLMDLHPDTHCRNEPARIDQSPLGDLPYRHCGPVGIEAVWDEAVSWIHARSGEHDRAPSGDKRHIHDWAFQAGLGQLAYRRSFRRALSWILPSMGGMDWKLPPWVGSRAKLAASRLVIKQPSRIRWFMWVLQNRPETKMVHIVRHPGGSMNSWRNRYLAAMEDASVRDANRARLRDVLVESPDWSERFGEVDSLDVFRSEAWYWCYATTMLHRAGEGRPNYYALTYEDLVRDQVGELQKIFAFCDLDWDPAIESRISTRGQGEAGADWMEKVAASTRVAESWHDELSDDEKKQIEEVLAASACADWWGEGETR